MRSLPDRPPPPPLNLIGDYAGGSLYLAIGLLSAVLEARSSGRGQVVDAAIVDGVAHLMTNHHGMLAAGIMNTRRGENILDGGAPFYDTYICADGRYVTWRRSKDASSGSSSRLGIDPETFPPPSIRHVADAKVGWQICRESPGSIGRRSSKAAMLLRAVPDGRGGPAIRIRGQATSWMSRCRARRPPAVHRSLPGDPRPPVPRVAARASGAVEWLQEHRISIWGRGVLALRDRYPTISKPAQRLAKTARRRVIAVEGPRLGPGSICCGSSPARDRRASRRAMPPRGPVCIWRRRCGC